jgi:hypothetical protein
MFKILPYGHLLPIAGLFSYRIFELDGALEDGISIDIEIRLATETYRYFGCRQFQATRNGFPTDPTAHHQLLGQSIESLVSYIIAIEYPRALGASKKDIDRLQDGTLVYRRGALVEE